MARGDDPPPQPLPPAPITAAAISENGRMLRVDHQIKSGRDQISLEPLPACKTPASNRRVRQRAVNRQRYLLLLVAVLVFVCLLLLALYLRSAAFARGRARVCLTSECVSTAASLLAAMDRTVEPCDDFFRFACGAYNKEHIIPEDRSSISTFEVLSDHLQIIIKGILEEPMDTAKDSEATLKAKKFFRSCSDINQIKRQGERSMREALAFLGGWPVLDQNWQPPNVSLEELLGGLRGTYNLGVIFEQWVGPDDRNSSINIIQIDQMGLALPSRDYFINDRYNRELESYRNFMTEVAVLMGADPVFAQQEMRLVLQLDIRLSNASVPEADRHDTGAIYTQVSLRHLEQLVPGFRWRYYLQSFLLAEIGVDEPVVVYSMPYLKAVSEILMQTDRRIIHNYAIWRLIRNVIPHMTPPYQQLLANFRKVLLGIPSDRNRWNLCVEWTNQYFGMAVGALFIKDKFNEESKRTAMEMIGTLREAFIELLDENQWMDDATRQVARGKAMAMNEHIGYPEFLSRPDEVDKEFDGIEVTRDRFLVNIFHLLHFRAQRNIKKLRKPVTKRRWTSEPPVVVVNAFYNPNKNDIVFPAGILQPLFYSRHFPKSLNYGGIGVVIGHEITHGFDDKGRQFDKQGNMKQWWNNATVEAFQRQIQCMVDQYSSYRLEDIGLNVNGRMTRGENIADNGGLKQSFRAYKKWVAEHGEEPLLPGIDLNHDQLFFLNYAQIWCGTMRPEDAESKIMSSVHAPGPIRVLGPLSNSMDFARAYQCPVDSRMNPTNKCTVW